MASSVLSADSVVAVVAVSIHVTYTTPFYYMVITESTLIFYSFSRGNFGTRQDNGAVVNIATSQQEVPQFNSSLGPFWVESAAYATA